MGRNTTKRTLISFETKDLNWEIEAFSPGEYIMRNKPECVWWVRIHRSCVKTDEDAEKLFDLQHDYEANYNTQTTKSMWFDCPTKMHAIGFINHLTSSIPYLKVTMGNNFIKDK